jgi:hypothetical protein
MAYYVCTWPWTAPWPSPKPISIGHAANVYHHGGTVDLAYCSTFFKAWTTPARTLIPRHEHGKRHARKNGLGFGRILQAFFARKRITRPFSWTEIGSLVGSGIHIFRYLNPNRLFGIRHGGHHELALKVRFYSLHRKPTHHASPLGRTPACMSWPSRSALTQARTGPRLGPRKESRFRALAALAMKDRARRASVNVPLGWFASMCIPASQRQRAAVSRPK